MGTKRQERDRNWAQSFVEWFDRICSRKPRRRRHQDRPRLAFDVLEGRLVLSTAGLSSQSMLLPLQADLDQYGARRTEIQQQLQNLTEQGPLVLLDGNGVIAGNGTAAEIAPERIKPYLEKSFKIEAEVTPARLEYGIICGQYDTSGDVRLRSMILGLTEKGEVRVYVYNPGNSLDKRGGDTSGAKIEAGKPVKITASFDQATQAIVVTVNDVPVPLIYDDVEAVSITVQAIPFVIGRTNDNRLPFAGQIRKLSMSLLESGGESSTATQRSVLLQEDAALAALEQQRREEMQQLEQAIEASSVPQEQPAPARTEAVIRNEMAGLEGRIAEINDALSKQDTLLVLDGSQQPAGSGNIVSVASETVAPMLRGGFRVQASVTLSAVRFSAIASKYGDDRTFLLGVTDGGEIRCFVYGKEGKFGGNTVGARLQAGVRFDLTASFDPVTQEMVVTKDGIRLPMQYEDTDHVTAFNEISVPATVGALSDGRLQLDGKVHTFLFSLLRPGATPAQKEAMASELQMLNARQAQCADELRQVISASVRGQLAAVRDQAFEVRQSFIGALAEYSKAHPELNPAVDTARILQDFLSEERAETREITGRFAYAVDRNGGERVFLLYKDAVPAWAIDLYEGNNTQPRRLLLDAGSGEHRLDMGLASSESPAVVLRDTVTGRQLRLNLRDGESAWNYGRQDLDAVPSIIDGQTKDFDVLLGRLLSLLPTPRLSELTPEKQDRVMDMLTGITLSQQATSDLAIAAAIAPDLFGATPELDRQVYDAKVATMANWGNNARPMLDGFRRDVMAEVAKRKSQDWAVAKEWLFGNFFYTWHQVTGTSPQPLLDDLKQANRGLIGGPEIYRIEADLRPLLGKMVTAYLQVLAEVPPVAGPVSRAMQLQAQSLLESQIAADVEFKGRPGVLDQLVAASNGIALPDTTVAAYLTLLESDAGSLPSSFIGTSNMSVPGTLGMSTPIVLETSASLAYSGEPLWSSLPDTTRLELLKYAKLASAVYSESSRDWTDGNKISDDWDTLAANDSFTRFKACLYVHKVTQEVVLAFRGTEKDSGVLPFTVDLATDGIQWLGALPFPYLQAAVFARAAKAQYGDRLTIVGHSMGGGLATFAGLMTQTKTVTFNAAGLGGVANFSAYVLGTREPRNYISNYNIVGETTVGIPNLVTNQLGNRYFFLATAEAYAADLSRHSILRFVELLSVPQVKVWDVDAATGVQLEA